MWQLYCRFYFSFSKERYHLCGYFVFYGWHCPYFPISDRSSAEQAELQWKSDHWLRFITIMPWYETNFKSTWFFLVVLANFRCSIPFRWLGRQLNLRLMSRHHLKLMRMQPTLLMEVRNQLIWSHSYLLYDLINWFNKYKFYHRCRGLQVQSHVYQEKPIRNSNSLPHSPSYTHLL